MSAPSVAIVQIRRERISQTSIRSPPGNGAVLVPKTPCVVAEPTHGASPFPLQGVAGGPVGLRPSRGARRMEEYRSRWRPSPLVQRLRRDTRTGRPGQGEFSRVEVVFGPKTRHSGGHRRWSDSTIDCGHSASPPGTSGAWSSTWMSCGQAFLCPRTGSGECPQNGVDRWASGILKVRQEMGPSGGKDLSLLLAGRRAVPDSEQKLGHGQQTGQLPDPPAAKSTFSRANRAVPILDIHCRPAKLVSVLCWDG